MPVIEVKGLDKFKEIINGDKPAVFDFWATWCGPCRMISPVLERLSDNVQGTVDFYKVDVDSEPEISQEVGIKAMPTFMVFQNGGKVGELVGANPKGLEDLVTRATSLV